jgi:hypothetical protein
MSELKLRPPKKPSRLTTGIETPNLRPFSARLEPCPDVTLTAQAARQRAGAIEQAAETTQEPTRQRLQPAAFGIFLPAVETAGYKHNVAQCQSKSELT